MTRDEVLELAKRGKENGCSEALITLGELPEVHDMMRNKLEEWDYSSTAEYLTDLSKEILDIGLLPHTNPGILEKEDLKRLRKWNASMGLMLESTAKLEAHENSPGKDPDLRVKMIKEAGELQIPFTTGILIGIGESWEDRVQSLLKIREIQEEYGHIQEVIIQPFLPKKGTPMENKAPPDHIEILNTVSLAKNVIPNMNIQVPPNLSTKYTDLFMVGANDLGGISTETPDFINPEYPWPNIEELRKNLEERRFKLIERLPIYPELAKDSNFMSPEVKEVVKDLSDKKIYGGNYF